MTYSVPRAADRKSIRYHPDYALPPFYCRRPHPPQGVPTFTDQRTLPYLPTIHDALLTHGAFGHSPCGNLIFSPICTQPVVFRLGQVLMLSNKDMPPKKFVSQMFVSMSVLKKNALKKMSRNWSQKKMVNCISFYPGKDFHSAHRMLVGLSSTFHFKYILWFFWEMGLIMSVLLFKLVIFPPEYTL